MFDENIRKQENVQTTAAHPLHQIVRFLVACMVFSQLGFCEIIHVLYCVSMLVHEECTSGEIESGTILFISANPYPSSHKYQH